MGGRVNQARFDFTEVEMPHGLVGTRDAKGRTVLEVDEHGPVVVSRPMTHAEADAALAAEEGGGHVR